jgi:hypothetical protein
MSTTPANNHEVTIAAGTHYCAVCLRNVVNTGRKLRHQPTPKAEMARRLAAAK